MSDEHNESSAEAAAYKRGLEDGADLLADNPAARTLRGLVHIDCAAKGITAAAWWGASVGLYAAGALLVLAGFFVERQAKRAAAALETES